VRLLFDQNLSHKLATALGDIFPDSLHVREIGLVAGEDADIWRYAQEHSLVIVSKDSDFQQRSFLYGHPPKVIWVRAGNRPTGEIAALLRQFQAQIRTFVADPIESHLALG